MDRCDVVRAALVLGLATVLPVDASAQITRNQIDTFETATTLNWANGGAFGTPQPTVVTGGMGGANDHYLQVTADGSGPQGRLSVFNRTQWLGNYNAAGVNAVEMDLRNFSATVLAIRIGYKVSPVSGSPGYSSTTGFTLANDGLWHHAVFSLADTAMSPINLPSTSFNTLLNGPGEMRILHSATPSLTGDNVVAVLGVDNIKAVPEPVGILAVALMGAVIAVRCRRRGQN